MQLRRMIEQCSKELRQFWRDRLTVGLAFALPLSTLLIYGFAIRLETNNIPIAIQDLNRSVQSRTYIARLVATQRFQPVPLNSESPQAAIDRGAASAALIIPPDFSRKLMEKKPNAVQVLVDATDVTNARAIDNSIQAATRFFLQSEKLQSPIRRVVADIRLWFNPGRKESLFIVPGVYGFILAVYPSLLSAIAMVRDKEEGTIIQAYASGIGAIELLLGKTLAYLIVGLAEAIAIIGLGSIIWKLGIRGDPIPLILGTPLFLLNSIIFGLLVGTRTKDQSSSVQMVQSTQVLSSILLSGLIYPISNIPVPLSAISYLVPARYYIDISRDTFVRGTGWSGVWFDFPMLLLLGSIFLLAAWANLRQMRLKD